MSHTFAGPQRLGNILVEKGILSLEKLHEALEVQKRAGGGKLLGEILALRPKTSGG
jgi:hypothetical protein